VYKAARDFYLLPYKGYQKHSIPGVVIGLSQAVLMLLFKPLAGALAELSTNFDNLSFRLLPRLDMGQKAKLKRTRPPRFFRSAHVPLTMYTAEENIGQELLSRVSMGDYRAEGYLWHTRLKVLTVTHLLSLT